MLSGSTSGAPTGAVAAAVRRSSDGALLRDVRDPADPDRGRGRAGRRRQQPGRAVPRGVQPDPHRRAETVLPRPCASCGGVVGADGYCETCGTKAPSERDHYVERPASWVAACCDRGVRHHRNEDATAIAASAEPGKRAVLVVCDGVSTADGSDVGSLAAARAARDVLVSTRPAGLGVPESRAAAIEAALVTAAERANAAVVARPPPPTRRTRRPARSWPSCSRTTCACFGNVGDSRAYWITDPGAGDPVQLTVDDSVAQLRIAAGVPKEEAEAGPQAHAILKWLGRDSQDFRRPPARCC